MKTDGSKASHPFFERPPASLPRPRRLVQVRAIGPRRFRVADRVIEEGELVQVDDYVATDLVAIGKAEYIE